MIIMSVRASSAFQFGSNGTLETYIRNKIRTMTKKMMMISTVMMLMIRPYLIFYIRFKCPVRPDLKCRRCADMIIMMTAGDAEDAS